ncbi:hypothetical protein pdam_00002192, partial [Pocillopora damicornis]
MVPKLTVCTGFTLMKKNPFKCYFECVSEDRCLSYNFLPIHDKETSRCQLSGSDRFVSQVNFTKEDGALYRGIQ